MSLFNKLKSAATWQASEVIVTVLTQFIYLAVMARLLSKSDFGMMAITSSFIMLGFIFVESGMGAALIQRQHINGRHITAAMQGGILLGLLLFLIFFFLSPYIASFFSIPELKNLIRVISINFLISSASSVSLGLLHKNFNFQKSAVVTIFSITISYTLGILLAIAGFGVWSLVYATLLNSWMKAVGYFIFAKVKWQSGIFLKEWSQLLSFGLGIILLKFANYIGRSGINLVLGKIFDPGVLGVFERTFQIKSLPASYLGNILDTVMFPAMSEIQDDDIRLYALYQQTLGLVNSILMPVALYLIFFSQEVVLILLGSKWPESVLPLQIMLVALPFSASGRMADAVIRAKGRVYANAFRKFLYVSVLIAGSSWGALNYGLNGAATAVTVSSFFNYITMLFLVKSIFGKGIIDIFLRPVLEGLRLAGYLLIPVSLICFSISGVSAYNLPVFLLFTFFVAVTAMWLLLKRPDCLGVYIEHFVIKIREKNAG